MADNQTVDTFDVATDKVTYSGDVSQNVQLFRPVSVTGAEGSKTVVDLTGTAGSPSTGVITVQGVVSGTAMPVSIATVPSHAVTNAGTFVVQENGAALTALQLIDNLPNTIGTTTSGTSGSMILGSVTTSAPTYTTAQLHPLSLDTAGALRVSGASGTTQYAEEAAHVSGDSMVIPGAVRRDTTPSSSSSAAGRYSTLNTDANGRLYNNSALYTPLGDSAMNDTADAVKVLAVDSTGTAVATAVARTTDTISAALATDVIMNSTTALTYKFAKIAASSSGNNTLVSAVVSKKIRVLAYSFMGAGAVNAKFQDGASGTDLTGLKYIAAAGGGICAPFNPAGWFEGTSNTLMNLNLSGAVAVGGEMTYVEV